MSSLNYDDVLDYVRDCSTDPGNPPYDLVGVTHLFIAAIGNLRNNAMSHELGMILSMLHDHQRDFLHRMLESPITDTIDNHE